MLALTENVTAIVNKLTEEPEVTALRIASEGDGQGLSVSPVAEAQPNDQTIQQDGATVHIDGAAADLLSDKVLDGGVDQDGNIQFGLVQQA